MGTTYQQVYNKQNCRVVEHRMTEKYAKTKS